MPATRLNVAALFAILPQVVLPKHYDASANLADNPNTNQELRAASATEWLQAAINQALTAGVTRKQMHLMVATAPPPQVRAASPEDDWSDDPLQIVYSEVPDGLLTVAEAAAKYQVRHNTLTVAIYRGTLPRAGRIRGRGYGAMQHLISEVALRRYLGLDPEIPEAAEDQIEEPEVQPHPAGDDLVIHDELPEGCITLTEGARRYGIPLRRMRNLVRKCRLTKVGYLRGRGPQGGALLLLEAEVAALDEAVPPDDSR